MLRSLVRFQLAPPPKTNLLGGALVLIRGFSCGRFATRLQPGHNRPPTDHRQTACMETEQLDATLRALNIKPTRRRRAALESWIALEEGKEQEGPTRPLPVLIRGGVGDTDAPDARRQRVAGGTG